MKNNFAHHRINDFLASYEHHLNRLFANTPSSAYQETPHTFTDRVMELGPMGIVYAKKDEEKKATNYIHVLSSENQMLDQEYAISKVQWRYEDNDGEDNTEVDFCVFYLVKLVGDNDVRIFASITGDEEGLQEYGLRSLYKLYMHEKRKQVVSDGHARHGGVYAYEQN